jgi:hypothetical protein
MQQQNVAEDYQRRMFDQHRGADSQLMYFESVEKRQITLSQLQTYTTNCYPKRFAVMFTFASRQPYQTCDVD